jgi:hypothetical protein
MPPIPEGLDEEQRALLGFLLALRLDRARDFLGRHGLARYGSRADLRERLEESLLATTITTVDLVDFLDEVEPWAKQHVFLYQGGDGLVAGWRDAEALQARLAEANVAQLLNARIVLALPEELTLSSITVESERFVTISAVERREYREREPARDRVEVDSAGRTIELIAYVNVVTRGLIIFRWDLVTNTAALHITQGGRSYGYEDAEERFARLVQPFLAFDRFTRNDLQRVISRLHELAQAGTPEARPHRVGYRSRGGISVEAASATYRDSVTGEAAIDTALTAIAGASTGRLGNFFWLAGVDQDGTANPLPTDLHVVVIANESRVNFMIPSSREVITYVLQRIRALS